MTSLQARLDEANDLIRTLSDTVRKLGEERRHLRGQNLRLSYDLNALRNRCARAEQERDGARAALAAAGLAVPEEEADNV